VAVRIVVAYKWASNPQEAVVSVDGHVDWSRARPGISEYDPVAIELARRLADATGGEVIGLTAGTKVVGTAIACKTALSRGLDRAVIVADDTLKGAGATELAGVLAAAVRHIGDVDLVVTGDSSMDVGAKMVPTILAGRLGWPAVADVTAVATHSGALQVERTIPSGTQILEISGPAVVAASADAAVVRVPGMRDILAAGKKPVEYLTVAALDVPTTGPAVTVKSTSRPDLKARKGRMIDAADPVAAATELVSALRSAGAL
jgi:electron transfer flavoprotein beta subunit